MTRNSTLNPDAHPTVLFALGQTRATLKHWGQSAQAFEACAAAETHRVQRARALGGAGMARFMLGEVEAAKRNLEAAVELRPDDVSTLISLAGALPCTPDPGSSSSIIPTPNTLNPETLNLNPKLRSLNR